jgi:fermentation-respiration switch protein FrsA (DUF1100 family)
MTRSQFGLITILLTVGLQGCANTPLSPLASIERSLVYPRVPYPIGDWEPDSITPEDAFFEAADGTELHGWYLAHPDPVGVALYCHGNSGNVAIHAEILRELRDMHRLSVLVFDYRGYGRSKGKPHEAGLLQDARAARAWLANKIGVAEPDIILIGRSLGGGVAVQLAAADGCRGLVVERSFTSLPDVAAHVNPWIMPRVTMQNRFPSLETIPNYHGPLLVLHGTADDLIPFEQGVQLFEAANEPKKFVALQGVGHNDSLPQEYHSALDEFLASLP